MICAFDCSLINHRARAFKPICQFPSELEGAVMELDVGLICDAAGCTFSTPDMGPGWYPAMVAHLQVGPQTQS